MMHDPSLASLVERRRHALDSFIRENSLLFAASAGELEQVGALDSGPFALDGWVLITATRSLSDPDAELVDVLRSPGMSPSRRIGLVAYAR